MTKRKDLQTESGETTPGQSGSSVAGDVDEESADSLMAAPPMASADWSKMKINFKSPDFQHSFKSSSKNKKTWRNLKQIISLEQSLPWPEDTAIYSSIDAPSSFRPFKKYSDISGLEANYTDPQTRLHFADAEEFKLIRKLPSDIVAGYLTLRRANILLQ